MRIGILQALVVKEARRHWSNRGGLVLCLLLVVAALLLSVFNPGQGAGGTGGGPLVGGVHRCLIQYGQKSPLIAALERQVPPELQSQIQFEEIRPDRVEGLLTYPPGVGAIQLRTRESPSPTPGGAARVDYEIAIWHPPEHPEAMAAYEAWFWRAARIAWQEVAQETLRRAGQDPSQLPAFPLSADAVPADDLWAVRDSFHQLERNYATLQAQAPTSALPPLPRLSMSRHGLGSKELDLRTAMATGMVVFALYFFCVYLLPTMTCEERERGVLLAQALSPATPAEIVLAKFLFYPVLGMALAALIAGIYKPAVLGTLFFWLAILSLAMGFLGIGMTVATLARTQRAAFMGSMCYLMSVSLLLMICSQNGIPWLPWLAVEYHGPRVLHAAVSLEVQWHHWGHLLGAASLGLGWMLLAGWLFRRRGWQ